MDHTSFGSVHERLFLGRRDPQGLSRLAIWSKSRQTSERPDPKMGETPPNVVQSTGVHGSQECQKRALHKDVGFMLDSGT